jgi:hypothetical protein
MNNFWIWQIGGLIPHYIKLEQRKSEKSFELRALFWSILVCLYDNGDYQLTIQCPLLERLRE